MSDEELFRVTFCLLKPSLCLERDMFHPTEFPRYLRIYFLVSKKITSGAFVIPYHIYIPNSVFVTLIPVGFPIRSRF